MRRFLVLLILLAGCRSPEPVFLGSPTDEPVTWDLAGTWSVIRFEEPPGGIEWEGRWVLERVGESTWRDSAGQGTLTLSGGDSQILTWARPDGRRLRLSVNHASLGFLRYMTGDDGGLYCAIRSD